jgi:hypothetical protein
VLVHVLQGMTQLSLLGGGVLIQGPITRLSESICTAQLPAAAEAWLLCLLAPVLQAMTHLSWLSGGVLIPGPAQDFLNPSAQHSFLQQLRPGCCACLLLRCRL